MQEEIKKFMELYFKAKDNTNILTEDNKVLLSQTEFFISSLPENSEMKKIVDGIIEEEFEKTKKIGNTKCLAIADELRQQAPVRALVKKEEYPLSNRAAFINIAILIYGIINVGLIVAMALIK